MMGTQPSNLVLGGRTVPANVSPRSRQLQDNRNIGDGNPTKDAPDPAGNLFSTACSGESPQSGNGHRARTVPQTP
jgi:hypothetical protein